MECSTRDFDPDDISQRLYKHISASEYRVVHLLPGRFLDEIQCVLEMRSFKVKTRYEALSYEWGDESNTKPIRIARFCSSFPPTSRIPTEESPQEETGSLAEASRDLQAEQKWDFLPFWVLAFCLTTVFIWRGLSPKPIGPPDWAASFISRDVYIALLCISGGGVAGELFRKAFKLVIEVAETKPWLLVYNFNISRSGWQRDEQSLDFETLQVTSNLELALRHLRWKKRARTLWIDALCINQGDDAEKLIQFQRMDVVYTNASPVVVWLGGYHGLGKEDICAGTSLQEGVDCDHRLQIQAAFDHIWVLSGWRLMFDWYFSPDEEDRFKGSRSGLREIARRGWWERLWVIQEVALATGRVIIQCGHNTCDFEEFTSAQSSIILKHPEDKALKNDFQTSKYILTMIKAYGYSSFYDREGPFIKTLFDIMMSTLGLFFRDVSDDVGRFYKQPFAQRLHHILIKTAGRFKCREAEDRLYAVLGIAGGATTGKVTEMANFVEIIGSTTTLTIIVEQMHIWWGNSNASVKLAARIFSFVYGLWGIFYDSRARHWAISRPGYVVAGYTSVINAVKDESGAPTNRVKFFTALAKYLARETNSLAFLDVATCGEHENEGMPSWVPNWSRVISGPAYDFAARIEKDQDPDRFEFIEGGKTLKLEGRPKGTVNVMQPPDLDLLQILLWHGASEEVLALSSEEKRAVVFGLQIISAIMYRKPFSILSETKKHLISQHPIGALLELGFSQLRAGATTVVYTDDAMGRETGYLTAGEAVSGDQLVFVPSCYHCLVLRRRKQTAENLIRWKLVGLVATASMRMKGRSYSKSEWAQLLKDGTVHEYIIE